MNECSKSKHFALNKQKANTLKISSNRSSDFKPHVEVLKIPTAAKEQNVMGNHEELQGK